MTCRGCIYHFLITMCVLSGKQLLILKSLSSLIVWVVEGNYFINLVRKRHFLNCEWDETELVLPSYFPVFPLFCLTPFWQMSDNQQSVNFRDFLELCCLLVLAWLLSLKTGKRLNLCLCWKVFPSIKGSMKLYTIHLIITLNSTDILNIETIFKCNFLLLFRPFEKVMEVHYNCLCK